MHLVGRSLIALWLVVASVASAAAPVTFSFGGTVTSDPFGLSSFGAPIGGSFTFDSAAVDAVAAGDIGSFVSSGPTYGFTADVDGTTFAVPGSVTVNVADGIGAGVDQYGVIAQSGGLTLELFLEDATGTALGGDALPLGPPPLSSFAWREFRLFGPDVEFLGSIDALACVAGCVTVTPVPVPEPGALLLGTVALAALARGRARRVRAGAH